MGEGTRLTFNELDARSRVLARRLLGRGVAKRTHVGVSFGNNPDFLVSLLAVSRIGAVAVPISTFAPGRELLRLIRYGDLAAILTTQQVVGVDQVDRLTAAIPGLAETKGSVLTLPAVPSLRWIEFAALRRRPAAVGHPARRRRHRRAGRRRAARCNGGRRRRDRRGVDDPHLGDDVGPEGSAAHPRHRVLPRPLPRRAHAVPTGGPHVYEPGALLDRRPHDELPHEHRGRRHVGVVRALRCRRGASAHRA